jgi:hypothetical protein
MDNMGFESGNKIEMLNSFLRKIQNFYQHQNTDNDNEQEEEVEDDPM